MKSNKKQIISILAVLTMAILLSCAFVACDKVDTDKTGTDIAADYKVTIHPNNGQGDIVWDITKEIPTITKDGYHIAGYFLDAQLTISTTLESLKVTGITKNIDVYVKWEEDVCEHVAITDAAVEPTCTEKGLTEGKHCSKCGKILTAQTEIDALGHDLETHDGQEATCTEKGWKAYVTCKREGCDHTTYEEIPALGHTGGTATCTEQATCERCNEKYGNPLGHDLEHHAGQPATCTEKGWHAYDTCKRDGCTYTTYQEIDALGHDLETHNGQEATCTEKGWKEYDTCKREGCDHTTYEEIPALGHTGGKATCTEQAICERCGNKYGDALGHKYGDLIPKTEPTCSENGVEAHYKCSVCNKVFKDDEHKTETTLDELTIAINPNAHNFGEWIKNEGADTHTRVCSFNSEHTETESCHGGTATCTEQAICERCGNKYGESLGHAIVHHEAKAPTCTEIGWEAYDTCSRCDYTTYVEIPAGHNFNESGVCNACGYFETGLAFELNEDGESYSVVGIGTFDGTDLKIPNVNFDTKPVTGIKSNAFENCGSLTSVTIPDSVTSIGSYAFDGCNNLQDIYITDIGAWCNIAGLSNLMEYGASNKKLYINNELATSITIPDSVTSISYSAFRGCTGLTSVTIGGSVTSISKYAFSDCTGLTTVNWNATACTSAGSYNSPIFKGCSNLATVNIGDNVKIIPHYAFYNCTGLTNVTIPDSVTSIGEHAFSDCTGLTSVTIGNSVTSIGDYAFDGCKGLKSITIPDSVTSTGNWAFYNTAWYNNQPNGLVYAGKVAYKYKGTMSSNTSILLKEGTLGIGGGAFSDCTGLTSVTIPDSVTSIGGCAFQNCTGLTSITIPNSVTSIDFGAFRNCTGLTTVNWNATACTITHSGVSSIFNNCSNIVTVNIGDNVKIIPSYAFRDCTGLTNITIPDSVTSIGGGAFDNTLWYDDQPDGLVYAGKVAYTYKGTMPSNTSIVLEEGTLGIADYAFEGCTGLTSITIPDSVTSIGSSAFLGCTGLTSVTIGGSVTSIGSSAFRNCTGLTRVTIPDSVTSIGEHAFQNCTGLTSITIGGSVTSIGSTAFYGCKGLTSITIPNSVTSIDSYAFFYCTGLTSVTIPDSVTSIGNYAFYGCSGLTSVTIGKGVTSIGKEAFFNCTGLTSVTIGNSVTSIGESAFSGCKGLTSITIPNGVKSIGSSVFCDCTGLTSVKFNGTIEQWNAISKGSYWKYNVPATQVGCTDGTVSI